MAFTYLTTQQSSAITVPCSVMWDSGIAEANPESGPTATVKFKCLWDDHYRLVQNLLGQWSGTPPANVQYTTPAFYPPSPNLVCTSISSITKLGSPHLIATNFLNQAVGLPWVASKRCIVTANLTRPPYQPATSGAYFSIKFAGAGEFLTLPETTYRFGDGTPTTTPIGILIPEAQVTVTRFKMPFIPDQAIMQCIGQLNNGPFQIGYNVYNTGCLLFMPGSSEIEADVLGNITYSCEYRFMAKARDWNQFLHPNRTTGFATVTDGNGGFPYSYTNFGVLP